MVTRFLLAILLSGCGAAGGPHGGDRNLPSAETHPFEPQEEAILSLPGIDLRCPVVLDRSQSSPDLLVIARGEETSEILAFPLLAPGQQLDPDSGKTLELLDGTGASVESDWLDLDLVAAEGAFHLLLLDSRGNVVLFQEEEDSRWHVRHQWDGQAELDGWGAIEQIAGVRLGEELQLYGLDRVRQELLHWTLPLETNGGLSMHSVSATEDWGPPELWESDGISSLSLVTRQTPAGRTQYRLWYGGQRETAGGWTDGGLGFAASWDGEAWMRSPYGGSIVTPGLGEKEPMEWRLEGSTFLLYSRFWRREGINRHVIGIARFQNTVGTR